MAIYGNKRDDIKTIRELFKTTHNIAYEIMMNQINFKYYEILLFYNFFNKFFFFIS